MILYIEMSHKIQSIISEIHLVTFGKLSSKNKHKSTMELQRREENGGLKRYK